MVLHTPLYLAVLFVSQLKKVEEFILSGSDHVQVEVEQSAKVCKRLLDCELHRQAEQRAKNENGKETRAKGPTKQADKNQPLNKKSKQANLIDCG